MASSATSTNTSNTAAATADTSLIDTFDPRYIREVYNIKPHPETGRLIDNHPGRRTKPMRVLCLGQSRTGTMAIFTALKQLGYTPYHMSVAVSSPKTSLGLWCEALNAKYHGKGKPWGREEFDKILGDYDAVADVPCICFVEELVAAYPEAKVIVTQRDVDDWLRSMSTTAGVILKWPLWDTIAKWDPTLAGPFWEHALTIMPIHFKTLNDFSPTSDARQAFFEHYERIKRTVPEDRRLYFRVQEGWEPVCKFLDEPVPETGFPRVNDAKQFVFVHGMMWWIGFGKMVGKISLPFGIVGGGMMLATWWRRLRP